ncbi:maltotransferase domain-containing protein [Chloroflexota bacterium]
MEHMEGKNRVIIEGVSPEIDGGRFPIERIIGDKVTIEADIFVDGHDVLSAALLYHKEGSPNWTEVPMEFLVNDRWRGSFVVSELGRYLFTFIAWVDRFKTWQQDMVKKVKAKQDVSVDLLIGAQIIEEASQHAKKRDVGTMQDWANSFSSSPTRIPVSPEVMMSIGPITPTATYHGIQRELKRQVVPSPTGNPVWERSSIAAIVNNPVYAGRYYALRHESCEPKNTWGRSRRQYVNPTYSLRAGNLSTGSQNY